MRCIISDKFFDQCSDLFSPYFSDVPNLVGTYGRSCVRGKPDVYSYQPYTNLPVPQQKSLHHGNEPVKKGLSNKPGKSNSEASQSSEVYDISRFQKVMTKTQMVELNLPSPPLLQPEPVTYNR